MAKPKSIELSPEIQQPLESPSIYWTKYGETMNKCPYVDELHTRSSMLDNRNPCYERNAPHFGLRAFVDAVKRGKGTLKIVDPYFGLARIDDRSSGQFVVADAMLESEIEWVKIICEKTSKEEREKVNELLRLGRDRRVDWVTLKGSAIELHDRFLIIDQQLWHFGADVGGAHKGITMSTGAWCARTTEAERFFDELWNRGEVCDE